MILTYYNYSTGKEQRDFVLPYELTVDSPNVFENLAMSISKEIGVKLFFGGIFAFYESDNIISCEKIENEFDFLCFLHEVGHWDLSHRGIVPEHPLIEELLAWQYAFKKFGVSKKEKKEALKCIDSYVSEQGIDASIRAQFMGLKKIVFG